jgi:hypothetical protein
MNTTYTNGTDDVTLFYFNGVYTVSFAILSSTEYPKKSESIFESKEVAHESLVKNGYEIKS